MEFVARWYLAVNDERTIFEYMDHDPTRYQVVQIINVVDLEFDREANVFKFDADTVEALDMAIKHHDEMGTPTEPMPSKKPKSKSKKPSSKSKKPAAKKRSREENDDDDDQDDADDDDHHGEEYQAPPPQQQNKDRAERRRRREEKK